MRTITYTYDEDNITNKDYLILELTDNLDSGCDSQLESIAENNISCPYYDTCNCLNERNDTVYGTREFSDNCIKCKLDWLERNFDTYPHEDWESEATNE